MHRRRDPFAPLVTSRSNGDAHVGSAGCVPVVNHRLATRLLKALTGAYWPAQGFGPTAMLLGLRSPRRVRSGLRLSARPRGPTAALDPTKRRKGKTIIRVRPYGLGTAPVLSSSWISQPRDQGGEWAIGPPRIREVQALERAMRPVLDAYSGM